MATGYGQQARFIVRHLVDLGVEVAMSVNVGHYQTSLKIPLWQGGPPITVLPGGPDDSGTSVIEGHVYETRPDYVLTLYDACGLHSRVPGGPFLSGWGRFNFRWVPYAMVDDGPPLADYHRHSLAGAHTVLTLTEWALGQLEQWHGCPNAFYVPHTVDPVVFRPQPKAAARRRLNLSQDAFIVGFVGDWEGWPSRKGLFEAVEAFSRLGQTVGFADLLFLAHTKPTIEHPPMVLDQVREVCGIPRQSWAQETDYHTIVGRPTSYMADLYSAMDVLLLPSKSEGFGLTAVEAELCGTPTIVTSAHALQETADGAWKVAPRGSFLSWKLSQWSYVSPEDVFEALHDAYLRGRELLVAMGVEARARAISRYSYSVVHRQWTKLVRHLEGCIAKPQALIRMDAEARVQVAAIVPYVPREWPRPVDREQLEAALREQGVEVVFAKDDVEAGYPRNVNTAAAMAIERLHPEWLLIWNDDALPDDRMVKYLLAEARANALQLVAPVVLRVSGEKSQVELAWEVYSGGVREVWEDAAQGGRYYPLGGPFYQSLFLVRADVWQRLSGFDERFSPGYYEDADFVRRVVAHGYKAGVILSAKCVHHAGSTFDKLYTKAELGNMLAEHRQWYNHKWHGA